MKSISNKHYFLLGHLAIFCVISTQINIPYNCQAQDKILANKNTKNSLIRSIDGVVSLANINEIDTRASLEIDKLSLGSQDKFLKNLDYNIIKYVGNERVSTDLGRSGNLPSAIIKFGSPDVNYLDNDIVRAEILEQLIREIN